VVCGELICCRFGERDGGAMVDGELSSIKIDLPEERGKADQRKGTYYESKRGRLSRC
jgi:hypothetical protein